MSEAPPAFDARRLVALVRQRDPEAIRQAYLMTFGNEVGRLVLAHHMAECGVGNPLGREDLKYRAGMHDAALQLAAMAGFDQASVAVAVLSDDLEERTDETSQYEPPAYVLPEGEEPD